MCGRSIDRTKVQLSARRITAFHSKILCVDCVRPLLDRQRHELSQRRSYLLALIGLSTSLARVITATVRLDRAELLQLAVETSRRAIAGLFCNLSQHQIVYRAIKLASKPIAAARPPQNLEASAMEFHERLGIGW